MHMLFDLDTFGSNVKPIELRGIRVEDEAIQKFTLFYAGVPHWEYVAPLVVPLKTNSTLSNPLFMTAILLMDKFGNGVMLMDESEHAMWKQENRSKRILIPLNYRSRNGYLSHEIKLSHRRNQNFELEILDCELQYSIMKANAQYCPQTMILPIEQCIYGKKCKALVTNWDF